MALYGSNVCDLSLIEKQTDRATEGLLEKFKINIE